MRLIRISLGQSVVRHNYVYVASLRGGSLSFTANENVRNTKELQQFECVSPLQISLVSHNFFSANNGIVEKRDKKKKITTSTKDEFVFFPLDLFVVSSSCHLVFYIVANVI